MQYITPPDKFSGGHNAAISQVKGFAIILMVLGHSGVHEPFANWIYTFHMPLFLMASGYFFNFKYLDDKRTFIKKRIKGLYWPLLKYIWFFILIRNILVALHVESEPYGLMHTLRRMVTALGLPLHERLISVAWFVVDLFIASILVLLAFSAIRWLLRKIRGTSRSATGNMSNRVIVITMIGFLTLGTLYSYHPLHDVRFAPHVLLSATYFIAGMLLRRYEDSIRSSLGVKISVAIVLIYLATYLSIPIYTKLEVQGVMRLEMPLYFILTIPITVAMFNMTSLLPGVISKKLDWLGQNTMPVMMMHFSAFLLVTYAAIEFYGLDIDNMLAFPVLGNSAQYPWLWIVYTVVGLAIPLTVDCIYRQLKTVIKTKLTPATAES